MGVVERQPIGQSTVYVSQSTMLSYGIVKKTDIVVLLIPMVVHVAIDQKTFLDGIKNFCALFHGGIFYLVHSVE